MIIGGTISRVRELCAPLWDATTFATNYFAKGDQLKWLGTTLGLNDREARGFEEQYQVLRSRVY